MTLQDEIIDYIRDIVRDNIWCCSIDPIWNGNAKRISADVWRNTTRSTLNLADIMIQTTLKDHDFE